MADALAKHAFVSAIPEGTDATKVRTSAWNAALLFSAGVDGEVLTRSAASATGAAWSAVAPAPAGTLTGATLAANVLASSLTSLGTLASLRSTGAIKLGADISLQSVPSDLGGVSEVATNAFLYLANTFDSGAAYFDQVKDTSAGAGLVFRRARGTAAAPTDVTNGQQLGYTDYRAYSGTKFWQCASIAAHVDGVFTTEQAPPSRLVLSTNAANGGSTERMRISNDGAVTFTGANAGVTNYLLNAPAVMLKLTATTGTNTAYAECANTGGILRLGRERSTGGGLVSGALAYAGVVGVMSAHALQFATNSAIQMTILSAGNVGIGTAAPNANAILDLVSTTKAFMPPRMTTTERDAIASPTAGMVVYNSTTGKLNVRGAAGWEAVTSA